MFSDGIDFWPIYSWCYLIFKSTFLLQSLVPKTFLLLSKLRLFSGSHFHWPRKDMGQLLDMQLSMQIYRQRFSPQSPAAIRTNKDGGDSGELQYTNCIPRGFIRSLLCWISKKWVSPHDFVLCAFFFLSSYWVFLYLW